MGVGTGGTELCGGREKIRPSGGVFRAVGVGIVERRKAQACVVSWCWSFRRVGCSAPLPERSSAFTALPNKR